MEPAESVPAVEVDAQGFIAADVGCRQCSRSLRGQRPDGQCPGCGAPIGLVRAVPTAALDEAGHLAEDVVCRRCGYNLRGLSPEGRCPECGTPVGPSIHGDLLRYSDPAWVSRLATGCKYAFWGVFVAIGVGCLGCAIAGFVGGEPVEKTVDLAAGLLGFYGAWLITSPDPSQLGHDRLITARKVVRACLLAGLVGEAVDIGAVAVAASTPVAQLVFGSLVGLLGLADVAGGFVELFYLEKLAQRIPDDALARRARFLRWAYGITLLLLVAIGTVIVLFTIVAGTPSGTATAPGTQPAGPAITFLGSTGPVPVPGAVAPLVCIAVAVGIAFLVFSIMYLVLLLRLSRAFQEQAEGALRIWSEARAGPHPPAP